jgi:hypothetical protein
VPLLPPHAAPSTLLHVCLPHTATLLPDDVASMDASQLTVTPTGSSFIKPSTRAGVLPAILAALMSARATTRAALKGVQQQQRQVEQQQGASSASQALAARAAVLDGRQKALKLTSNALYGFTGAQVCVSVSWHRGRCRLSLVAHWLALLLLSCPCSAGLAPAVRAHR